MTQNRAPGATLELRGLTKAFSDAVVVDEVALAARSGEFVTLLGPSGSGKTTTLNMVAGFVQPDAGEILIDGQEIGRLPPHKRGIGMVFQHYALFPHMTVFDNVAFPLKERRMKKPEITARVEAALELVRLVEYPDRYPRQLSGGQQQRVALARAIVFEPSVLLMDEPLGALDKHLRELLQVEIKRIHEKLGITFVYVTHDQDEAIVLSDRIAVFNEGRIEQLGAPQELYERPATLFVAEFLGESNVLRGRVDASQEDTIVLAGDFSVRVAARPVVGSGEPCLLVVRPEDARLSAPTSDAGPNANAIAGTVTRVDYFGATRKVQVQLATGETCVVREQGARNGHAREGERVVVSWDPERGVVLPPPPSA